MLANLNPLTAQATLAGLTTEAIAAAQRLKRAGYAISTAISDHVLTPSLASGSRPILSIIGSYAILCLNANPNTYAATPQDIIRQAGPNPYAEMALRRIQALCLFVNTHTEPALIRFGHSEPTARSITSTLSQRLPNPPPPPTSQANILINWLSAAAGLLAGLEPELHPLPAQNQPNP